MTKVTFKKYPRNTGLSAIGYSQQNVEMKLNKRRFGTIYAPNWQTPDGKWSISIMVKKENLYEDDNPNCSWKWVTAKQRFDGEDDARKWIQENIEFVLQSYLLHFDDDRE